MVSLRSRLDKLEAAVTPRLPTWSPAVRVMANETTTDAEVAGLLDREGIASEGVGGPWVIVHKLVSPGGGNVLPDGPYIIGKVVAV